MRFLPSILVVASLMVALKGVEGGCWKEGKRPKPVQEEMDNDDSKIYTASGAEPSPVLPLSELPSHWDWCNKDGKSFCSASWNQHIPNYCGACWIHGSLSAVNDRINIAFDGLQSVMLARQVIVNCAGKYGLGDGCHGGEAFDVFEYMHRIGLPDETCQIWQAKDQDVCDPAARCINCMPIGEKDIFPFKCWAVPNPVKYRVKKYGKVKGEAAIMSEIMARGPVTCGFASTDEFDYTYRGGIFQDHTNATDVNHDVEVVGWGEENGVKYWKVRNSWGTYWGELGFFKLIRGVNNMLFEDDCAFAIVDIEDAKSVLDGSLGGSMYGLVDRKTNKITVDPDWIEINPQPQVTPQVLVEQTPSDAEAKSSPSDYSVYTKSGAGFDYSKFLGGAVDGAKSAYGSAKGAIGSAAGAFDYSKYTGANGFDYSKFIPGGKTSDSAEKSSPAGNGMDFSKYIPGGKDGSNSFDYSKFMGGAGTPDANTAKLQASQLSAVSDAKDIIKESMEGASAFMGKGVPSTNTLVEDQSGQSSVQLDPATEAAIRASIKNALQTGGDDVDKIKDAVLAALANAKTSATDVGSKVKSAVDEQIASVKEKAAAELNKDKTPQQQKPVAPVSAIDASVSAPSSSFSASTLIIAGLLFVAGGTTAFFQYKRSSENSHEYEPIVSNDRF